VRCGTRFLSRASRDPDPRDARRRGASGALVLGETPFHHGGGRQLPDRGVLRWSGGEVRVVGVDVTGQKLWHVLADPVEVSGTVEAAVDPEFRELMIQLPLAPIS